MNIPNFSLKNKVAVITGGKRGIGKALALTFAEAGADVVVCSRKVQDGELASVAEEIHRLGRRSLALQTDITRKSDVEELVQRTIEEFGCIDILDNGDIENSKSIHKFLCQNLGEDNVTFSNCFDIPLQIITEKEDILGMILD